MLSCREVATTLASGELEGSGPSHRLAVWFHLLICAYCRAYARQMRLLGEASRRLLRRERTSSESLARLEERLAERCRASRAPAESATDPDA